ncbi:MAG: hypothetical protein Q9214_004631, partial [Letrouitia sp. 1 TL-2023]
FGIGRNPQGKSKASMADFEAVITLTPTPYDDDIRRVITLNQDKRHVDIGRASKSASKGLAASQDNAWFDSPIMSRLHGTLRLVNDHVELEDGGSTHGTFIRTKKLIQGEKYPLKTGDVIVFGATVTSGPVTYHARSFNTHILVRPWIREREPCFRAKAHKSVGFRVPVEDLDSSSDESADDAIQVVHSRPRTFLVPSSDEESDEERLVVSTHLAVKFNQNKQQVDPAIAEDVVDMTSEDDGPEVIRITQPPSNSPKPSNGGQLPRKGTFIFAKKDAQHHDEIALTESRKEEGQAIDSQSTTPQKPSSHAATVDDEAELDVVPPVEPAVTLDVPSSVLKQPTPMPDEDEFGLYGNSKNVTDDPAVDLPQDPDSSLPPSPCLSSSPLESRAISPNYSPVSPQYSPASPASSNLEAENRQCLQPSPESPASPPPPPFVRAPSPSDAALARKGKQPENAYPQSSFVSLNHSEQNAYPQAPVYSQTTAEIHRPSNMPGHHNSFSSFTNEYTFAPPCYYSYNDGYGVASNYYAPTALDITDRCEANRNWLHSEPTNYSDGPFTTSYSSAPPRPISPMQAFPQPSQCHSSPNLKSCVVKLRIDPSQPKTHDQVEQLDDEGTTNGRLPATTKANNPQESRVNISNLVNPSQENSRSLKRKIDAIAERSSIESPHYSSEDNTQSELLPDAQARDLPLPVDESLSQESPTHSASKPQLAQNTLSMVPNERPAKRARTSASTSSGIVQFVSGVFVGFAGVIALVLSIPERFAEEAFREYIGLA